VWTIGHLCIVAIGLRFEGKASDYAGKSLSHLFEAAGFTSVQVIIPEAGVCK
jgi:hypothetical protein